MDRRSPSNGLSPQVTKRQSPTYYRARRDHRGGISPPRAGRKRSPSLSRCMSDQLPSQEVSLKRNRRAVSPAGPKLKAFDFAADDDEARQTFYCKHCNVELHDLVSMESHLRGKPHLMQQKRLKDYQLRIATDHGFKARHPLGLGQVEYNSSAQRKSKKTDQERWPDESSRDKINPKFQADRYDQGEYSFREEKRRMGQRSSIDEDIVIEKENESKSALDYRKEATSLKKQVKILQSKVDELQEYKKFCLNTHENKEFKELLEHERQCIENHQRPIELQKPGIHCKQERDISPHKLTNRRSFKRRRSYNESDEDMDRKMSLKSEWRLDEGKQDIKLNWRSGEGNRRSFKSERQFDGGGSWHTPNESNESRDGVMEYIENEIDDNLKVESDHIEEHEEYVESEMKNESNFDDDIILVE